MSRRHPKDKCDFVSMTIILIVIDYGFRFSPTIKPWNGEIRPIYFALVSQTFSSGSRLEQSLIVLNEIFSYFKCNMQRLYIF